MLSPTSPIWDIGSTLTKRSRVNEEKYIRRVVLLGSTFVVLIVSLVLAYLLISSEIDEFENHLDTFKQTLIQREKFSIKAIVDNLINDIKYEEDSKRFEIKRRIKNQINIAYNLIALLIEKNKNISKEELLEIIKGTIRGISIGEDVDFFIFDRQGVLLLNSQTSIDEGKSFIDAEDINGKKFVQAIVQKAGFTDYVWFVPDSSKVAKKIVYARHIEKLGITIGTGEFLDMKYDLNQKIIHKINESKFNSHEFVFIYEIKSLRNPSDFARRVLEKNIKVGTPELEAVKAILIQSDYQGNIFYAYDNRLVYSSYLSRDRIAITAGVELDSIHTILQKETTLSHDNLMQKIVSVVMNILFFVIIFFVLSYFLSKKIEKMFWRYRLRVARSQKLLIQKSKMASMGEMIGNIAHQWRQPLSQLSGLFFDIESAYEHKELNQKYLAKSVDEANDLIEYMSKTIDDFREFYNPDAPKEIFRIKDAVDKALKLLDASLKFNAIGIELQIEEEVYIEGLSNEFSQVVLNILSNAKEIALEREIAHPHIKIYTIADTQRVSLVIEDNCGGIEKGIIRKVFDPYFTTKYGYGSGIGLYMSRLIIENKMGGKITVRNLPKGRLRFEIVLTPISKV